METVLLSPTAGPATLDERLGSGHAAVRRALENKPQRFGRGKKHVPLQALEPLMTAFRSGLERLGLYQPLAERAVRPMIAENRVYVRALPSCMEGLRILHLSDLHIDGMRGFGARLADLCEWLNYDIACITGDLRLHTEGPVDRVMEEMRPLVTRLRRKGSVFAVLGNHDVLDLVPPLEAEGVRYLLNESVALVHRGARYRIAGVDDVHYYGTDDLERSIAAVAEDEPTIFLCHSPDLIREAAEADLDLYLCGHTHGGQLCLPGGKPLVSNANCARRFISGPWRYGVLQGYTSRGVGFSGIPLRSFCRPEIVVHELRRERRNPCRMQADAAQSIAAAEIPHQ